MSIRWETLCHHCHAVLQPLSSGIVHQCPIPKNARCVKCGERWPCKNFRTGVKTAGHHVGN